MTIPQALTMLDSVKANRTLEFDSIMPSMCSNAFNPVLLGLSTATIDGVFNGKELKGRPVRINYG